MRCILKVKTQLAFVEWSPDGKNILFCTLNGEAQAIVLSKLRALLVIVHVTAPNI